MNAMGTLEIHMHTLDFTTFRSNADLKEYHAPGQHQLFSPTLSTITISTACIQPQASTQAMLGRRLPSSEQHAARASMAEENLPAE
jgi:hypothetical protein